MFRKLVSNLAFSPALVGQLGFYAKRLRKEESVIQGKGDKLPEILHARTNCVTATFKNDDNELSHLTKGLPEGLIQKFVEKNPEIKSVEQPFPSFRNKEAENDSDFYTQISERLRHKNRASSS